MAWRLLGPWRPPDFAPGQEEPLRLPGRTVFVGRREYFLREAGPEGAPSVLLVPGWGADTFLNWHKIIPILAERRRVVAIDPRGQGKTDRSWEPLRLEDLADELAGVMEAIGLERVAVAGYSMGGMLAMHLARRHPQRMERLVLAATAARVPLRARRLRRSAFVLGRAFERISPLEGAWLRSRYLLRMGAVEPRHAAWLWEHFMTRDPTLFYEAGLAAIDFDARGWAGELDLPALVVIPTGDPLIRPHAQYELAEALPRAEMVELPEAGHEACFTHPEELAKAILEFLER